MHMYVARYSFVVRTTSMQSMLLLEGRDEAILLFFLPIFLSGNSFFLAYYAQYFARSCNILLKV